MHDDVGEVLMHSKGFCSKKQASYWSKLPNNNLHLNYYFWWLRRGIMEYAEVKIKF